MLADRVQLQQVILNLIINGAEAMAAVTDRERRAAGQIGRLDDPDGAVMTVADSGTGIEPSDTRRAFSSAFFTTKSSGMGMGLSDLPVDRRGPWRATVGVGRRSHGAVFHIVLPVAEAAHDKDKSPRQQPVVFVVDDDASLREALESLFRSVGLQVETLRLRPEFLRRKLPDAPSCLVLDVQAARPERARFSGRARQGQYPRFRSSS